MIHKAFREYEKYLRELGVLVQSAQVGNSDLADRKSINHALNGQTYEKLCDIVPRSIIRLDGAFFTGHSLAKAVGQLAFKDDVQKCVYLDPACGTGDLLAICAQQLKTAPSLEKTLAMWGEVLIGRDINPAFIDATRKRLALLAIKRGARSRHQQRLPLARLLPHIRVGNALQERKVYGLATHILANPPYVMRDAAIDCAWASGRINYATEFVDQCIRHAREDATMVFVLPEVLRAGSRYEAWRKRLQAHVKNMRIRIYGRFDQVADVDVFILKLQKRSEREGKKARSNWGRPTTSSSTVGDKCEVRVGPVVPHRDKHKGDWHMYAHAGNVGAWKEHTTLDEKRRFAGRTFTPPFVLIRRTSRPDHPYRAIGTLIKGKHKFAIENHLVICIPRDGTLKTCRQLVKVLKSQSTNAWLNERIRCRHLTTTAVASVPWRKRIRE